MEKFFGSSLALVEESDSGSGEKETGSVLKTLKIPGIFMICEFVLFIWLANSFQSCVAFHTETSQLICTANSVTGFYMKVNIKLKWVKVDCWECRSSRSQIFLKIGVLKNYKNFTEKHLCWSLLLAKLQALGLQIYQKETPTPVFSCGIWEVFKNIFFFT